MRQSGSCAGWRRQLRRPGRRLFSEPRRQGLDAGAQIRPWGQRCPATWSSASAVFNVQVVTGATVNALEGRDGMLKGVCWQIGAGQEARRPINHLFLFIGADPNTDWLKGSSIALDAKGFVLTGGDAGGGRHALEPRGAASSPSAMYARTRS